jgi:hypothetical protein
MGSGGWRFGAGRPAYHVKADSCLRLDLRDVVKRRLLGAGDFSWRWKNSATCEEVGSIGINSTQFCMVLSYSHNGVPISERVEIDRTPCTFGGTRPWLRCPRCARRVAVLYLRSSRFVCRRCGGVVYGSQSEDAMGRAWRRQSRLEARLGADWRRPKGMHHRTHRKLMEAILACEQARDDALADFMIKAGLLGAW